MLNLYGNETNPAKIVCSLGLSFVLSSLGGCHREPKVEAPPYVPHYSYNAPPSPPSPIPITVAVMNPVIKGKVRGADGAEMMKALPGALMNLISAKGMRYSGPFEQRDTMTYPEKSGADLLLYPELEIDAFWVPANTRYEQVFSGISSTCDISVTTKGRANFIVVEPLTNEVLWRKTVEIQPQSLLAKELSGPGCVQGPVMRTTAGDGTPLSARLLGELTEPSPEGEAGNMFRWALENAFFATMTGIDRYVSAQEFAMLKRQSEDLRQKKVY